MNNFPWSDWRQKIPPAVLQALLMLQSKGHQAYLVGGGVRDLFLERTTQDWDVCTSALPDEVIKLFHKVIPTGLKHGTVTVMLADQLALEVTTLRVDSTYADHRHPDQVIFTDDLAQDLARRDFTINAMACDPHAQKIYDLFDGQGDINKKIIRCVGDPMHRFNEDGLRPWRAIRFAAQLEFHIEPNILSATQKLLAVTQMVAVERMREEFNKILTAAKPSLAFEALRETGLLAQFLPELLEGFGVAQNEYHAHDVYYHTLAVVDASPPQLNLRLAALFHDIAKPRTKEFIRGANRFYGHDHLGAKMAVKILKRLKYSNKQIETIQTLVKNHMFYYQDHWSDGAVRRLIKRVGEENLEDLFALRIADEMGSGVGEPDWERIEKLKQHLDTIKAQESALSIKDLAINGQDLMQILNLPSGPQIGKILAQLLEEVLEDPTLNTQEILLQKSRELVGK